MGDLEILREYQRSTRTWRVALAGEGTQVAGLWLWVMRMRIGLATVGLGGIGGVGTEEEHRKKGYASQVMWDSVDLMSERGIEMSILFGIQDFYHRHGFGVVFANSSVQVATRDLGRARRRLAVRQMKKSEAPQVLRLYNRLNAGRTGTVARYPDWQGFRIAAYFTDPGKVIVVLDDRDRIRGYAHLGENKRCSGFCVSEAGGTDAAVYETLASEAGRRASRCGLEEVVFHLPKDDDLGAFLGRYGCRWDLYHPRSGGPMGRIILLDKLFEKLCPELSQRWARGDTGWRGTLSLHTDIGTVGLRVKKGLVEVVTPRRPSATVEIPQLTLTQLVMGYRDATDVAYDDDVSIPRRALPVMDALFPRGYPYMWWADRV